MSSIKIWKSMEEPGFKEAYPEFYEVFAPDRKFESPKVQRMWDAYTARKNRKG